ncbi:MAG: dTDP-4-dehydrorhamnose 3,5-epimerase [Pseudomonadota bacterium]
MPFSIVATQLPEVLVLEPQTFSDQRGLFFESFNQRDFETAIGMKKDFVQDNHSYSVQGVVRGLHYQIEHPQGKLVRVVSGEVFDVAVDIRKSSPNFGKWVGVILSAENKRQMWIPEGYAHGFMVISDSAEFIYKTTDYWYSKHERSIVWNDPAIGIDWPENLLGRPPLLSPKDATAKLLSEAEVFP